MIYDEGFEFRLGIMLGLLAGVLLFMIGYSYAAAVKTKKQLRRLDHEINEHDAEIRRIKREINSLHEDIAVEQEMSLFTLDKVRTLEDEVYEHEVDGSADEGKDSPMESESIPRVGVETVGEETSCDLQPGAAEASGSDHAKL